MSPNASKISSHAPNRKSNTTSTSTSTTTALNNNNSNTSPSSLPLRASATAIILLGLVYVSQFMVMTALHEHQQQQQQLQANGFYSILSSAATTSKLPLPTFEQQQTRNDIQTPEVGPHEYPDVDAPAVLPQILAIYFPQFHRDPLNDRLWGQGFTDWSRTGTMCEKHRP
jgi:hypothetical protein